jgi:hypothetical protein
MTEVPKPESERHYHIGDVGAGARVAQGTNISWVEGVTSLPDGAKLAKMFSDLLEEISANSDLDEDDRLIAAEKTRLIAEGLITANESPTKLRLQLKDAKLWFSHTASSIGNSLRSILLSDAAQATIATITDSATKAAISQFLL